MPLPAPRERNRQRPFFFPTFARRDKAREKRAEETMKIIFIKDIEIYSHLRYNGPIVTGGKTGSPLPGGRRRMGTAEFENLLGRLCAPTFRAIKAGSLVALPKRDGDDIAGQLARYVPCLARSGTALFCLADGPSRLLVLFYRPAALERALARPGARHLLERCGDPRKASLEKRLAHLKRRLAESETFPHEIGLFLGYPPEDVRGFIEHRDCDVKCVGCWKVYGDEAKAQKTFRLFRKCSEVYRQRFQNGTPIERLTVAEHRGSGRE